MEFQQEVDLLYSKAISVDEHRSHYLRLQTEYQRMMYFEVRGYEYDIPVYIYHREYVPAGYQVPELLCYVVKCQMGNCPGCVHTHGKICSRALRRLHRTNGL